jgi:serine/threonine protein kinase
VCTKIHRLSINSVSDIFAKLTDFSNSIIKEEELRVPESVDLRYSAPEVLRSTPLNFAGLKAADVYSMAVTCFEVGFLGSHE